MEEMVISATKEYQRQKNRESYQRHKEARIKAVRATPNRKRIDRESYERHKDKRIEKVLKRVQENPEAIKATQKQWYAEHKEERLAKQKVYAEANPEQVKATTKRYEERPETKAKHRKWEHEHPEKVKAKNRQRNHSKRSANGHFTEAQWQARLNFFGRQCVECGTDWDSLRSSEQTMDHIIPLSLGGTNWPANLQPMCRSCNSAKSNKYRRRKKKDR